MGFRPPLDISEYLRGVPHISAQDEHGDDHVRLDVVRTMHPDERPITTDLSVVGYGPVVCSSCSDLVPDPLVCWDANGYYASLGVHWRATRAQLRRAFQERDGHSSDWLTYVLTQLLNPQVRRAYDRTPLGQRFLDDRFEQERIHRQAREAARLRQQQTGEEVSVEEVLEESGYVLDEDYPDSGDYAEPWAWAYYLRDVQCYDTDRLAIWQSLVVSELIRRGAVVRFAVGFAKTATAYFTRREGPDTLVAYLGHTTTPDRVHAEATASALMMLNSPERTPDN